MIPRLRRRLLFAVLLSTPALDARAQDISDADTLPRHVGGLIIRPGFIVGGGGSRFGPGWRTDRQSFLTDFDNLHLSEVLGGANAGALETLLGDLGTTHFQATQTGIGVTLMAAYGITDRWTVAAYLPFQYSRYKFDAWLAPSAPWPDGTVIPRSHFGVSGNRQDIQCPGGQFRVDTPEDLFKILQDKGDAYNFNIGDLRNALKSDCLDYMDPIDQLVVGKDGLIHGTADRSYAGFRDLILGTKYQFYHGSHLELAGIGYVIAPTGRVEDPRDLFSIRFGDGTWNAAALLGFTVPLGKLRFFGSGGYEYVFADTRVRRLKALTFSDDLERKLASGRLSEQQLYDEHLDDGSIGAIVTRYDQATVTRKLGDSIYVYSGASYDFLEWLGVAVRLDFWHHFRDEIEDIGPREGGASPYATEADIRATVDRLVRAGTVPEDTNVEECLATTGANCRTKELIARLRDSDGRRKAAYGWHTVRGQLIGGLSLNFNTLGPFLRNEFPLPIIASIYASAFLAGSNIDITDQIGVAVTIPIPFGDIKDPAEYGYDDEPGRGLPWP